MTVWRALDRADAGPMIEALSDRVARDAPVNPLRPGDLGWHLRIDADELAGQLWWASRRGYHTQPLALGLSHGRRLVDHRAGTDRRG
jgi:hypothetical protein